MSEDRYRSMPNIGPDSKIDFSEFHPIDHWPGTSRCHEFYGGVRVHLRYAWDFRWRGELRRWTLCKVGRHHKSQAWALGPKPMTWIVCIDCAKKFSEPQPD